MGARLFWLLQRPEVWIHRRAETVSFLDIGVVRRRQSVDFTYPSEFPGGLSAGADGESALVPLTFLRKRRLVDFDLRDEDGAALPLLTERQNSAASLAALRSLAEAVLGGEVPEEAEKLLATIVSSGIPESNMAFRALRESPLDVVRRFASNDFFLSLAQELTWNFVVLVPLSNAVGRRRVIKFAYEEGADLPTVPQSIAWQLGLRPIDLVFRTPAAGDGTSYHLEIEAPEELKIPYAQLSVRDARGAAWEDESSGLRRAHLHSTDSVRGAQGIATASIQIRRAGLLRGSLFVTAFVATLLLAIRLNLHGSGDDRDGVSALLAIVPPILATYVARTREHALVTEMLAGLRFVVLMAGLCSFSVGLALVLGARDQTLCWISAGFFVGAVAAFLLVFIAWDRAGPDRHDPAP